MIRTEPLALRVRQIEPLSATLKHVIFEADDGGLLPTSSAGAHLLVKLGAADRLFHNAYSIVSAPGERGRYEVIVRRVDRSRGGSSYIHDLLREGQVVLSAVPNNFFPVRSRARKHLLVSGGVGITPFLSYLPVLRADRQRLELHHFSAVPELPVFERLLAPFAGGDVHLHAGQQGPDIAALLAEQPLGTHVYLCGPLGLMETVQHAATALGWPAANVHLESFGATGGAPFTARLARSARDVAVGPDETLLDALETAGVVMGSLCRGGVCGECLTRVLDGEPDHRDDFLTALEKAGNTLVMPCVSRARGPILTLDL